MPKAKYGFFFFHSQQWYGPFPSLDIAIGIGKTVVREKSNIITIFDGTPTQNDGGKFNMTNLHFIKVLCLLEAEIT